MKRISGPFSNSNSEEIQQFQNPIEDLYYVLEII